MKKKNLIISAMLICGMGMFTACSGEKDNPLPGTITPVAERPAFEEQLSQDLQAMADGLRFDAASQTIFSLSEFIMQLDESSFAKLMATIAEQLLQGSQVTPMSDFSEPDKASITSLVKARLGMTDNDIQNMEGIHVIDAYNSIGSMKFDFKDGSCTVSGGADAFTIVSTNMNNETKTITLKFNDERDGVCFFVTRKGNNPVAIQLPKSIGVTVTSVQGETVSGTLNLTTASETQSKFVGFKQSGWTADINLALNLNNRQENFSLYAKHTEQHSFDLKTAFGIQGKEIASLEFQDVHDAYTDEEIESDEFKSMTEMGSLFSIAYTIMKTLKGKSVDNAKITINDNMVIDGKIDDVAKALIALGNARKLHGTQPAKETVDEYSQQLNSLLHLTVSQKNTGITAQVSVMTAQKDHHDGEYRPAVALQFQGETEAQVVLDRMSDTDKANYTAILNNFSTLFKEMAQVLQQIRVKGQPVVQAVKDKINS